MEFSLVAAMDRNRCIGKGGTLPWRIPADLRFFHEVTKRVSDLARQNAVVMGRKTWQSIPEARRPLPGRLNLVITSHPTSVAGARTASSLDEALAEAERSGVEQVYVIGGGQVFRDAITRPACTRLYLTRVETAVDGCDTFFPELPGGFTLTDDSGPRTDHGCTFRFLTYAKAR